MQGDLDDGHLGHHHGPRGDGAEGWSSGPVRRLLLAIIVPLAIATAIGLVVLWPSGERLRPPELGSVSTERATVLMTGLGACSDAQGGPDLTCRRVDIRLDSGLEQGERSRLEISDEANPGIPPIEAGDRIVVQALGGPGGYVYADHQRGRPLLLLSVVFSVLVVALARWKGVAALAGLVVTIAVILGFVLPSILDGHDPIAVSVVGSSVVLFVVFYLAHGVNLRASTALAGTLLSLVVTGLLGSAFTGAARLTGLASEEALVVRALADQVDPGGLLLGGIIIGTLGVLNDVTITQSSAVWQLHLADRSLRPAELYRRAMAVGRDHIGATVDTLVLAYAGAAMPLLVLFALADRSLTDVATSQVVAEEVVRGLVGAIGLVMAVPITTALAALATTQARR